LRLLPPLIKHHQRSSLKKHDTHLYDKGSHVGQDENEGEPSHWKQDLIGAADVPGKATKENVVCGNEETGLRKGSASEHCCGLTLTHR
jgi:hypothetical protein